MSSRITGKTSRGAGADVEHSSSPSVARSPGAVFLIRLDRFADHCRNRRPFAVLLAIAAGRGVARV